MDTVDLTLVAIMLAGLAALGALLGFATWDHNRRMHAANNQGVRNSSRQA